MSKPNTTPTNEPTTAPEIVLAPRAKLTEDGHNPRTVYTGIDDLAASIGEFGLLQPITVEQIASDAYRVESGHRRLRAMDKLGWTHIPCIVLGGVQLEESKGANAGLDHELRQLIENVERDDLLTWDLGAKLKSIRDGYKLSLDKLADRVHKSKSHVGSCIAVVERIPEALLKSIKDAESKGVHLTTTQLFQIAYASKDETAQAAMCADMLKGDVQANKGPKGPKADPDPNAPVFVGTALVVAVIEALEAKGRKADFGTIETLQWVIGKGDATGAIGEAVDTIALTQAAEKAAKAEAAEMARQERAAEREARSVEAAKVRAAKLTEAAAKAQAQAEEKEAASKAPAKGSNGAAKGSNAAKAAKPPVKAGKASKGGRARR